jgi:hypothetical protein
MALIAEEYQVDGLFVQYQSEDDEFADEEFDTILAEAGDDIQLLHGEAV